MASLEGHFVGIGLGLEVYELDPVWGLRAAVGQALDSKVRSQIPSFVLSTAAEALFCFLVDGGVVDKT